MSEQGESSFPPKRSRSSPQRQHDFSIAEGNSPYGTCSLGIVETFMIEAAVERVFLGRRHPVIYGIENACGYLRPEGQTQYRSSVTPCRWPKHLDRPLP